VVGIPLGIYLAFARGLGLSGLWIGIAAALICGGIAGLLICLKMDWDWAILNAHERNEKERQFESLAVDAA